MRIRVSHVWLIGAAAVLGACGGSAPTPPPAPPKPPVATAPKPAAPAAPAPATPAPAAAATAPEVPMAQVPNYEAKARRDPFVTLELREGAGGLTVAATKLSGIVRGSRTALALVEAPDGIGYILKPGDTLGDGRLLEIGSDSVVFAVTPKPGAPSNRVVLKLATN
ncbi:MAG: hypothetical protein A3D33_02165 [Candidatus Rokubacteria bacterium RIFCSPHIGHO2_02_FULL_73_26]|uniref:Nonfunctional Uncharacterized protein n=1 Tax=uncultured bacterium Rifle_16ft_4_minimus_37862 TaxID=1665157 RepID=A0A0H4T5Q6_9BACT